jgi:hypothetical protein
MFWMLKMVQISPLKLQKNPGIDASAVAHSHTWGQRLRVVAQSILSIDV